MSLYREGRGYSTKGPPAWAHSTSEGQAIQNDAPKKEPKQPRGTVLGKNDNVVKVQF